MGCDIHAMIEKKGERWWINAGDPEIDRNYMLFAVLANVRNDGDIPYISEPKGVPDDCCPEFQAWCESWSGDGHSYTYVTLSELHTFDVKQKENDMCNGIRSAWRTKLWRTLIATLEKQGKGDSVRLVFFFDN